MSKFYEKLSRKGAIQTLVEEGLSPEDARDAIISAEKENAEFYEENQDLGVCIFEGRFYIKELDMYVCAYYKQNIEDMERVEELEFLDWETPDWYIIRN